MTQAPPSRAALDLVVSPLLVAPVALSRLADAMAAGAFVGGWLITGPPQVGKAALAYQIAKTILSGTKVLGQSDPQTVSLVDNGGHPDLFVLARKVNEKTGRLQANIVVDDIRTMIARLQRTASSGYRVVIVDTADDLNREASNALLKILEEPPANTVMMALSSAPGRLLPTIRSRCRRLALPPLKDDVLAEWLVKSGRTSAEDANTIAANAAGRPGRAVLLTSGEGEKARQLVDGLVRAAASNGDLVAAAQALAAKDADDAWGEASTLILDRLTHAIKATASAPNAASPAIAGPMAQLPLATLFATHDHIKSLMNRANRLNSDRTHTALSVGLELRNAIRGTHAGR